MANTQWGNVYITLQSQNGYEDVYAGRLQEDPSGRCVFTYDAHYLETGHLPIAYTLPLRPEPFISEQGLHPFFDNMVSEGWLKNAQSRALGIPAVNRFALLLGFGLDLPGAVFVVDPKPAPHISLHHADEATLAALTGRASLSGIQRKLLLVKESGQFRPVGPKEVSTHIAKLASGNLANLIELEFLTSLAVRELLPQDEVAAMEIANIPAIHESALVVTRFDRTATGQRSAHFEEFNQLLGRRAEDKYQGDYADMAQCMKAMPMPRFIEVDRLFRRILASFLVGNTDAHFKNFALFHTDKGFKLTPAYDLVAAALYDYSSIALAVAGINDLRITKLLPKHFLLMGQQFGLPEKAIVMAVEDLGRNRSRATDAVMRSSVGSPMLKQNLIDLMEKRWNGSFKLTGPFLLKKPKKGVVSKS